MPNKLYDALIFQAFLYQGKSVRLYWINRNYLMPFAGLIDFIGESDPGVLALFYAAPIDDPLSKYVLPFV